MSVPFDLFGVIAGADSKVVAALHLPSGLTTSAGTITGGTVTGSAAVAGGASAVYLGLEEDPATVFGASADISDDTLPDASTRPYTVEARVVASGTDMTSYAAIAAAFAASTDVAYTRDVPSTLVDGYLRSGAWGRLLAGSDGHVTADLDYGHALPSGVIPGGTLGSLLDNLDGRMPVTGTLATTDVIVGPGDTPREILIETAAGAAVADVTVRITSDSAGLTLVYRGTTDAFGIVRPYLSAGTYYVWPTKTGVSFPGSPYTYTVAE